MSAASAASNHWPDTRITSLFNIALPLILSPMAGDAGTPELVAAVSNAGGLGSLGAGYMSPEDIRSFIKRLRQLSSKPFNINLFVPERHEASDAQLEQARKTVQAACHELNFTVPSIKPPYAPSFEQQMNVVLEEKVPVFSFTFGIPDRHWLVELKKNGIKTIGTATSLEEARLLEQSGVDAITAQGREAGGHRGTFIGRAEDALTSTNELVSLLVKHIHLPIIASGGIMNAKGIAASLALGAAGVQMGTAFLCCHESGIHPLYKELLLNAKEDPTTLTRAFSGKLARGLANQFIKRMRAHEKDILDYPVQNRLTSAMRREAARQNATDFMSMWAGQAAYLCKAMPAAELIAVLNQEMNSMLPGSI